jgi:hypothetical protein
VISPGRGDNDELDGFFDIPEDNPAKWLSVLTLRLDESADSNSGRYIVGGFIGNRSQWSEHIKQWREARKPYTSLHVSKMRLGAPKAGARYRDLLARLGPVPSNCGLTSIAGSICRSDYIDRIARTALDPLMEGYVLAILAAIDEVGTHLDRGERVQVFFEERVVHAALRERAMILWRKTPRTPSGWSVLSHWGSTPKGTLTEASDYLSHAILQSDIDPNSIKSSLTSPILVPAPLRRHIDAATAHQWIDNCYATRNGHIPDLTPEVKKRIIR